MLHDVTQWDAATSGERRAVAEDVAKSLVGFTLLRVRAFGFDGDRHEIAVYVDAQTGLEFALIPGGSFQMGSALGDEERNGDEPRHNVTLTDAFLLARTECTQRAYERVMGSSPATSPGGDFPVAMVSWDDAQAFCMSAGLRLPSEAEWEYTCRAGTSTRYWSGDSETDLARVGWYSGNLPAAVGWRRWLGALRLCQPPPGMTRSAGELAANPFGLYDVHGNVWEWCEDWYGVYASVDSIDPSGPPTGRDRVIRGGSWFDPARNAASAFRAWSAPGDRFAFLGFRPARTIARR